MTPAVDALDTWAQDYGLPHRILMSVGSNDIFTPPAVAAQVDRTMQIVGHERTVYWVNVQAARTAFVPEIQVADQRNSAWINLQLAEARAGTRTCASFTGPSTWRPARTGWPATSATACTRRSRSGRTPATA